MTSRLPLPLDAETRRCREREIAKIATAVAQGAYKIRAEDVADAIVSFFRRGNPGEGDRLADRR